MRLIDADKATAVVGYFLEQMGITLFGRKGKDLARTLLLQVPTIDAVSVVRCKDCKHWNVVSNGCMRNPSVEGWQADDFCSYGERREL